MWLHTAPMSTILTWRYACWAGWWRAVEGTGRARVPDCCSDLLEDPIRRLGEVRAPGLGVASGGASHRNSQFHRRTCASTPSCPLSTQTGHGAAAFPEHPPPIVDSSFISLVYHTFAAKVLHKLDEWHDTTDTTAREDYEGSNPVVIRYTCLTFATQFRLASVR